jgi:hypothetical protein
MLLCDEDLHVSEQLVLVFFGQSIEDGQITLEDRTPDFWRALTAETRAAA